jgi:hypothetical protein
MLSRNEALQLLDKLGLIIEGSLIENPDKPSSYLAFVRTTSDKDGVVRPTDGELAKAKKKLAAKDTDLSLSRIDDRTSLLGDAVEALLRKNFEGLTEHSIISLRGNDCHVYISLVGTADDELTNAIEKAVVELLELHGLRKTNFVFSVAVASITVTGLTSVLRKHAPSSVEELCDLVVEVGFEKPTRDWVNKTLDRWRKRRLVFRRADGRYILTLEGLNQLGTSHNRRSPDVVRALAIARRDD